MKARLITTAGNKKIILVGTFIFILLLMTAGITAADTVGPDIYYIDSPPDGGTITAPTGSFSIYAEAYDEDRIQGAEIKLNGVSGYSDYGLYDYNTAYVIKDLNNLAEGTYTLEISFTDNLGNKTTNIVTFDVVPDTSGPEIEFIGPVENATKIMPTGSFSISAGAFDTAGIASAQMTVNGESGYTWANYNNAQQTSYSVVKNVSNLAEGTYNVSVTFTDNVGYTTTKNWTFFVVPDTTGPTVTGTNPVNGWVTMTTAPTFISATLNDPGGINTSSLGLKLDGDPLAYTWYAAGNQIYYSMESPLEPGVHTAEVTATDNLGYNTVYTWSFTIDTSPGISDLTPANGELTGDSPTISAVITDPGAGSINAATISLSVDGTPVPHSYDPFTGRVSYYYQNISPGDHYVSLVATDNTGNTVSQNWNFTAVGAGPLLVKAEATSKQIIYLTFDQPIQEPSAGGGNITISGLTVNSFTREANPKILKVILTGDMGKGNATTYSVMAANIKNLAGYNRTLTTISFDAFTPHGKYSSYPVAAGSSNPMCGLCHSAHYATGQTLLGGTTIKKVCFVCHGTLGMSEYKVEGEFTGRPGPVSLSLHKSLDGDNPGFDILSCVDCHNPHGDRRSGNEIYPKLLQVSYNNKTYNEGNQICFYCHGNTNKGYEGGVYYTVYGGNHINPTDPNNPDALNTTGPVHYDNVNFASLNPASGTKITCVQCHEKHGSQYGNLLDNSRSNKEEQLCFKCHGAGSSKNKYADFFGATVKSRHEINDTTKGRVECTNCHGPHTVDNTKTATTKITSDPDNTKLPLEGSAYSNAVFCNKCHDGDPPVQTITSTKVVPYTVYFADIAFTNSSFGWNKKLGTNYSEHSMNDCSRCHKYHSSNNLSLLTGGAQDSDGYCSTTCHRSSARVDLYRPIEQQFWDASGNDWTYVHPTMHTTGVHRNTEDWAGRNVARHAECADCHDLHSAGHHYNTEITRNGWVTGLILNGWNGATWSNWDTTTPNWSLGGLDPSNGTSARQSQLCFKCHSKFSYDTPPTTPSSSAAGYWAAPFSQTDQAKEFNPSNPAYHAVLGGSKMPNYGKFTGGWTATSSMKCSDCHGYGLNDANRGVHGSPYRFILRREWNNDTGKPGTSSHLCFRCHDYNYYTGADLGNGVYYSQFSVVGSVYQYNAHHADHASFGCVACHGPIPHGWDGVDSASNGLALSLQSKPRPYSDGVKLTSYSLTANNKPGTWKGHSAGVNKSCGDACH